MKFQPLAEYWVFISLLAALAFALPAVVLHPKQSLFQASFVFIHSSVICPPYTKLFLACQLLCPLPLSRFLTPLSQFILISLFLSICIFSNFCKLCFPFLPSSCLLLHWDFNQVLHQSLSISSTLPSFSITPDLSLHTISDIVSGMAFSKSCPAWVWMKLTQSASSLIWLDAHYLTILKSASGWHACRDALREYQLSFQSQRQTFTRFRLSIFIVTHSMHQILLFLTDNAFFMLQIKK